MAEDKFSRCNTMKDILQNLLKQLLDKKIKTIENNSKEHLSILSSAKNNTTKMSNILTDIKKQIQIKQHPKCKLNGDKIQLYKSNKDFYHTHNRSKIKTTVINNNYSLYLNKKTITEKSTNHTNELHKSKIKNISKSKKQSNNKSKTSKINYFKNIQNSYLINLYGDNINIISNDDKMNYNCITHRSKMNLKKHNTMFNLYKKGIKKDNYIMTNHNMTSRYKSNNNSILDISDIYNRSFGKKNVFEGKKHNNINNKTDKKLSIKKNKTKKKTPCKTRKKSFYDIKMKNYEDLNLNSIKKVIKMKKLNETMNSNFKENKIIKDIISLNSSINKDELMIIKDNDNIFGLEYEDKDITKKNININLDIINKHSLSLSSNKKKILNMTNSKNSKNEESTNMFCLLDLINSEYYNYILEYLTIEDLLKIKRTSKKYNNIIINYFINKYENEKIKLNRRISVLGLTSLTSDGNKNYHKISLNSFHLNKTSEKAISLLNDNLLNKLFYSSTNILPGDDILLIYRIFFCMINHPIIHTIDFIHKKKFWENCQNFFINESKGKIGNLLFDIIRNKNICLTGKNILNIYNLAEHNLDKLIPSYFSKICGTTGLFVFFIKEVLDFLGITKDKEKKQNFVVSYNIIIDFLNEKILKLKKLLKSKCIK